MAKTNQYEARCCNRAVECTEEDPYNWILPVPMIGATNLVDTDMSDWQRLPFMELPLSNFRNLLDKAQKRSGRALADGSIILIENGRSEREERSLKSANLE